MTSFVVRGKSMLQGTIRVSGSKNATLPLLAASFLFKSTPTIEGAPDIEDVRRMRELISDFTRTDTLNDEIAKRFRASILLAGPILAERKSVRFPHPGGCLIGARPIDVFLEGWRAMGAEVEEEPKHYRVYLPSGKNLRGCEYTFRVRSVTGTESLMMTAVLAHGKTILHNAAREPEIVCLADFLKTHGVSIHGAGTSDITIEGSNGALLEVGRPFFAPPDRIEAGSLAILGALLAKDLRIEHCRPNEIRSLLDLFRQIGVPYEEGPDWLRVHQTHQARSCEIATQEYPGFPTDLQAPMTVLATQAVGQSIVQENIFEGRLAYTEDLNYMGARIKCIGAHRAIVEGPTALRARDVQSPDIRAGLALLIAGLIAEGTSIIGNAYQIDRGYERIDERLRALGADIKRM